MKNIIFVFLGLIPNLLFAQTSNFDPEKCGCSLNNPNQEVNYTELLTAFPNNDKANNIIDGFRIAKDDKMLKLAYGRIKANLDGSDLLASKPEFIKELFATIDTNTAITSNKEALVAAALVCNFAAKLHAHYTEKKMAATPNAGDTSAVMGQGAPSAVQTAEEGSGFFTMFMFLLLGASLLGNLFLLKKWQEAKNAQLVKQNNQNAQSKELAEKDKTIQALQADLEHKNVQIAALKKSKEELQAELKYLSERQEAIKVVDNTNQQSVENQSSAQQLRKYLYAPTREGIFYDRAVQPQKDSNAFYTMQLPSEQAATADFELIKDIEVIRRAEHLGLEPLLAVCELQGKGRIPQDGNFTMQKGTLRKDGAGWRVEKKIILSW